MSQESEYDNQIHSEHEVTFGAGKPERIVQAILRYRSAGSVLELGAGEGRNALYLAQNGFEVTAQDISEIGIDKMKKLAQEKGLAIKTEIRDSRTFDLARDYDIMICTFMLHHFSREEALGLIKHIQDHTNSEGLNAISAFTTNGDFYRNNPGTKNFYPGINELRELYADWQILEYEEAEGSAFAKKPDGSPMRNITARLLARKLKQIR